MKKYKISVTDRARDAFGYTDFINDWAESVIEVYNHLIYKPLVFHHVVVCVSGDIAHVMVHSEAFESGFISKEMFGQFTG